MRADAFYWLIIVRGERVRRCNDVNLGAGQGQATHYLLALAWRFGQLSVVEMRWRDIPRRSAIMAISQAEAEAVAQQLDQAEQNQRQIGHVSRKFPDMDIADAYAIQRAWVSLKIASGQKLVGWKIGLTSRDAAICGDFRARLRAASRQHGYEFRRAAEYRNLYCAETRDRAGVLY